MTTATLPTKVGLLLGGATTRTWCDSLTNIKYLTVKVTSANGTNYTGLQSAGSAYTVPAATNLRVFGLEDMVCVANSTNPTVFQFGYDDDGAGTNFVLLADALSLVTSANIASGTRALGMSTGLLTIPTGKHPVIKQTNTGTALVVVVNVIGIETA